MTKQHNPPDTSSTLQRVLDAEQHPPSITPAVMSEKDAARYIGMSVPFLRQSRMNGDRGNRTPGPAFIKVGRAIRYLRADLDAWLLAHRVTPKKID